MGFNILMTREKVIEKYGIPSELEPEIFAMLKPVGGSGANAQYLESRVDQQLEKYFANKERLKDRDAGFYPKEEANMAQTWADTVAEEDGEETSSLAPLEPLLVNENKAAQMLGVSRRKVFDLEKKGFLTSRMVGSRKLYSVKRLREFAEGKVA
jgi:hypothetical protein